jgi:hypothetical protein
MRRLTSPGALLALACALHLLLCLGFVITGHMWWYQDETVYLSQVGGHAPALVFTPPRARGLPILLFPMVHFTTHLAVVRVYISALGTALLYLGLRPWLHLGLGRVVALGAALFGTLWATTFFGASVQPNFFVAAGVAGALGTAILVVREPGRRRHLVVVGLWFVYLGLLRPSDATWFAAAMLVCLVGVRSVARRDRISLAAAVVVGLALGWSEWVIEAYASYGGFFHRLHEANAYNTPGIHFSLGAEARDVNGPVLCRPCSGVPVHVTNILWWFAIPPLVALGLYAARRTARLMPLVLATVTGTALAFEYFVTTNYAAPRFLLPTYLLLALPVAEGVVALLRWRPDPTARRFVAAAAVAVLAVQVVDQTHVLHHDVKQATDARHRFLVAAKRLHAAGVRRPCIIYGLYGPPVAFALGCNDHPFGEAAQSRVATGTSVVVITTEKHPPPTPGKRVVLKPGTTWRAHVQVPIR